MSERKINLNTFIPENMDVMDIVLWEDLYPELKTLLLSFGEQLLELAAENANINVQYGILSKYDTKSFEAVDGIATINKQSILDTIKQVE